MRVGGNVMKMQFHIEAWKFEIFKRVLHGLPRTFGI